MFASAYVWRGFVLNDGACVQPDLWAKAGPLTVTSWLNVRGATGPRGVTEHDLVVDFSHTLRDVTLSAGWINYAFIEEGGHTDEFYVSAQYETSVVSPGIQVFKDVGQGTGTYVLMWAERAWDIPGTRIAATARAGIGYNSRLWVDTTGFSDLNAGVELEIPVTSARLSVVPSINYSRSLQRAVFPSKLYGTVSVAFK